MPLNEWSSPITAELLAKNTHALEAVRIDENTRQIYGLLQDHNGHGRIVRFYHATDDAEEIGSTESLTNRNVDVTSKAHGYGGGAIAITRQGNLLFSDGLKDGVHLLNPNLRRLDTIIDTKHSERGSVSHFADFDQHPQAENLFLAIKEEVSHTSKEVRTTTVLLDTYSGCDVTLCIGADFYTHPRFSALGDRACWIQWNYPDMPWEGSQLYVADFDLEFRRIQNDHVITQHRGISQPRWGLDDSLFFVSDEYPFCQLCRIAPDTIKVTPIQIQGLEDAEMAGAEFKLGSCTYIPLTTSTLIASVVRGAVSSLISIDLVLNQHYDLQLPLVDISYDAIRRLSSIEFVVIGATRTESNALFLVTLQPSFQAIASTRVLYRTFDGSQIPLDWLSSPSEFSFPRIYGASCGGISHGFIMLPPKTPRRFQSCNDQPKQHPPCVVVAHGGPTRHHRPSVNWEWQLLTSRGIAVILLNHQGSTGYGKAHRQALRGRWGEADVDDVASCVTYLAETAQIIDQHRVGITGISAGGYCTLQSMCLYPDLLSSGISVAGISDMEKFALETHKFERHYDQHLIFGVSVDTGNKGLSNGAEGRDAKDVRYRRASPVFHTKRLSGPVLLLQGTNDSIVLPNQAILFDEAAKKFSRSKSLVEVVMYPDEGHGFHQAATIQDSLERQLQWWQKTLTPLTGR